jgi:hypothetical protein
MELGHAQPPVQPQARGHVIQEIETLCTRFIADMTSAVEALAELARTAGSASPLVNNADIIDDLNKLVQANQDYIHFICIQYDFFGDTIASAAQVNTTAFADILQKSVPLYVAYYTTLGTISRESWACFGRLSGSVSRHSIALTDLLRNRVLSHIASFPILLERLIKATHACEELAQLRHALDATKSGIWCAQSAFSKGTNLVDILQLRQISNLPPPAIRSSNHIICTFPVSQAAWFGAARSHMSCQDVHILVTADSTVMLAAPRAALSAAKYLASAMFPTTQLLIIDVKQPVGGPATSSRGETSPANSVSPMTRLLAVSIHHEESQGASSACSSASSNCVPAGSVEPDRSSLSRPDGSHGPGRQPTLSPSWFLFNAASDASGPSEGNLGSIVSNSRCWLRSRSTVMLDMASPAQSTSLGRRLTMSRSAPRLNLNGSLASSGSSSPDTAARVRSGDSPLTLEPSTAGSSPPKSTANCEPFHVVDRSFLAQFNTNVLPLNHPPESLPGLMARSDGVALLLARAFDTGVSVFHAECSSLSQAGSWLESLTTPSLSRSASRLSFRGWTSRSPRLGGSPTRLSPSSSVISDNGLLHERPLEPLGPEKTHALDRGRPRRLHTLHGSASATRVPRVEDRNEIAAKASLPAAPCSPRELLNIRSAEGSSREASNRIAESGTSAPPCAEPASAAPVRKGTLKVARGDSNDSGFMSDSDSSVHRHRHKRRPALLESVMRIMSKSVPNSPQAVRRRVEDKEGGVASVGGVAAITVSACTESPRSPRSNLCH